MEGGLPPPRRDGELRPLTVNLDREIFQVVWSTDQRVIATELEGTSYLMQYKEPQPISDFAVLPRWELDSGRFIPSSWSPDGRRVAGTVRDLYGDHDGIAILDLDSMEYLRLTDSGGGPQWFLDGQRLLYSAQNHVLILDTHTSESRELMIVRDDGGAFARMTSDGRAIILDYSGLGSDIYLVGRDDIVQRGADRPSKLR